MRIRLYVSRYSPRRRYANTRLIDLPELAFWLVVIAGIAAIVRAA